MLYHRSSAGRLLEEELNASTLVTFNLTQRCLSKPCIDTILVPMCLFVPEMCLACMSTGAAQFYPCIGWSSEYGMCMQERTVISFPDINIDHDPTESSRSVPVHSQLFFGMICQACHDLFRAHMLHPLAARWEVLGRMFLLP